MAISTKRISISASLNKVGRVLFSEIFSELIDDDKFVEKNLPDVRIIRTSVALA